MRILLAFSLLVHMALVCADNLPPKTITSADIALLTTKHAAEYSHIKPIGACLWYDPPFDFEVTPELDEYQPDLVVTVSNQHVKDSKKTNPWYEANFIELPADKLADSTAKSKFGFELSEGQITENRPVQYQGNGLIYKNVGVFGAPTIIRFLPYLTLQYDTIPGLPYYLSPADLCERLGCEFLNPKSWNPLQYTIGSSFLNKWGYEFPREMHVVTANNYKASIITALRAADIVTNNNMGHLVISTNNRCGDNCAVANVIEETNEQNAIWQEVYPHDAHIKIGESDAFKLTELGRPDDKEGNGNYVFVIWRRYQGCVQEGGMKLLFALKDIPPTVKR